MMQSFALTHRLLEPFGADVEIELARPLTDIEAEALRALFFEHTLLLFRGQRLSMDEQMRVVGYVGPLLAPSAGYLSPEDGILNTTHLDFHSDLCATPLPFDAISLLAQDVDEGRTSTRFASGLRAYRGLSDAMKAKLAPLDVNMVQTVADKRKLSYDVPPGAFNLVRPLVMSHRVTGEPILYCSESSASRIEGWARPESDALLAELFAALYAPTNVHEHVWRNGDLVLWDNLALQHARHPIPPGRPRRMQRVVAGLKTLREQVPAYDLTALITETDHHPKD